MRILGRPSGVVMRAPVSPFATTLLHLGKSKIHELFFEAFKSEPSASWLMSVQGSSTPQVFGSRRDLGEIGSDDERNFYHQRVVDRDGTWFFSITVHVVRDRRKQNTTRGRRRQRSPIENKTNRNKTVVNETTNMAPSVWMEVTRAGCQLALAANTVCLRHRTPR